MSPRAVIFNKYINTKGGGERSTLDLAKALDQLGFDITLVTDEIFGNSLSEVSSAFGAANYKAWEYKEFESEEALQAYVNGSSIDLFVNHSFSSFIEIEARRSLYMVMFPNATNQDSIEILRKYDHILCNSHFSKLYVENNWSPELNVSVLEPPISSVHLEKPPVSFSEKEKLIINIGRFDLSGHSKCQLDAINAFINLEEQGALPPGWKLIVAGHLSQRPGADKYLRICQEAAKGRPNIEILTNLSIEQLCALYRRAALLWQFTGVSLDFGELPQCCEHLGLVALDCFAYGTLPIIYQRSGMSSNIINGLNGYIFGDIDELGEIMRTFCRHYKSSYHQRQFKSSLESCPQFSFEAFKERLSEFVLG